MAEVSQDALTVVHGAIQELVSVLRFQPLDEVHMACNIRLMRFYKEQVITDFALGEFACKPGRQQMDCAVQFAKGDVYHYFTVHINFETLPG